MSEERDMGLGVKRVRVAPGIWRPRRVWFDGTAVTVEGFGHAITRDADLDAGFRTWLKRRGVVLP